MHRVSDRLSIIWWHHPQQLSNFEFPHSAGRNSQHRLREPMGAADGLVISVSERLLRGRPGVQLKLPRQPSTRDQVPLGTLFDREDGADPRFPLLPPAESKSICQILPSASGGRVANVTMTSDFSAQDLHTGAG